MTRFATRVTRRVPHVCPFVLFLLSLCCLSFALNLLVSPLVSSNFSILHYCHDDDNWVRGMVFTTTFQSYRGGKRNTRRKPTSALSQVTDKVYHIMLYRVHLEITTLKLIDTNSAISCSCKITFKQ